MYMFPLKIIFILVAVSGLIAYLGDLIGRRIGKKRLTIFNLRPRYTAIIITISSGILIAIFTFITLLLISQNARDALFNLGKIKEKSRTLEEKYFAQKKLLDEKLLEIKEENKKLVFLEEDLKKINIEYENTKKEFKKVEKDYVQAKNNLSISEEKLNRIKTLKENLARKVEDLAKRKKSLEEKIESLRKQGDEVFYRLKKVQEELRLAKKKEEKTRIALEETKTGKLIFITNQEIERIAISSNETEEKIKKIVIKALKKINEYAKSLGAKREDNPNEVLIVYQDQLTELIEKIKEIKDNVLVKIISSQNTLLDEPLYLKFEVMRNKLIFKADEVILSITIEENLDEKQSEEKLKSLLEETRKISLEKGVLPMPTGEVGEINALEFYEVISVIKNSKVKLKVEAVAIKDIYTSGPLEIKLKVMEQDGKNTLY